MAGDGWVRLGELPAVTLFELRGGGAYLHTGARAISADAFRCEMVGGGGWEFFSPDAEVSLLTPVPVSGRLGADLRGLLLAALATGTDDALAALHDYLTETRFADRDLTTAIRENVRREIESTITIDTDVVIADRLARDTQLGPPMLLSNLTQVRRCPYVNHAPDCDCQGAGGDR